MKRWCACMLFVNMPYALMSLSPGDIDTSFGTHRGYTSVDIGGFLSGALGVALQSDGKIVTVGVSGDLNHGKFAIVRFTSDGQLDTTFGADKTGIVTKTIGPGVTADYATDVKITAQNKIIISGLSSASGYVRFALLQLNSDGTVDTDFGDNGVVTTAIGSDDWALSTASALQSDGKIVVVGFWYDGDDDSFAIVRYKADGDLDTSFGNEHTGIIKLPMVIGHRSWAGDVKIQPDGKIVVGGYYQVSGDDDAFQLVRLLSGGTLDPEFGDAGMVRTTGVKASMLDFINVCGIALQPDGNIIFAGNSRKTGSFQIALARYKKQDGSLDTSFGPDKTGIVYTSVGSNAIGLGVTTQTDNMIVASGATLGNLASNRTRTSYPIIDGVLVRYTSDGVLDPHFGTEGYVTKHIGGSSERITLFGRILMQPDGKIVVSGGYGNFSSSVEFKTVYRTATHFYSFIARYIGWPSSIPDDEIIAAKSEASCPGLMASAVDTSASFYEILRQKFNDCKKALAAGYRRLV